MLIGYTDRFSVAPGEHLSFMISGDVYRAHADLVRLLHGDERSAIGLVEREVQASLAGVWAVEDQPVHPGSFGVVEAGDDVRRAAMDRLSGHVFVYPTRLDCATPQGIIAHARADGAVAWELSLAAGGDVILRVRDDGEVSGSVGLGGALRQDAWHSVSFSIDRSQGAVKVWSTPFDGFSPGPTAHAESVLPRHEGAACDGPLLLAARGLRPGPREPRASDTFNGKLERPTLFAGSLTSEAAAALARGSRPEALPAPILLDLDLGANAAGWSLRDRSPFAHVGRLYNAPLRSCTSHGWRGATIAPPLAPGEYAAIHFHDDDVEHANWRPTREWTVPERFESGVYALRLRAEGVDDRIPFVVRPPRDRATAAVALWLPSFTYAAYANARRCLAGMAYGEFAPERPAGDDLLRAHPEWGASTYDVHSDGSGVAISSLARPVPNLRPAHRPGLVNGPRHLGADLYLVHWLRTIAVTADVICDEDVHDEGHALLRRYSTVITGSHPEYVTTRELDAVELYTATGGRLMYMGGNGFYWVTSVAGDAPTTVEVRRGFAGTRAWDSKPGEEHHQFTGERGGLWRHRGRPPHAILGVGFVAEGWDGSNRPYHRQPDSFRSEVAWAFDGIGRDEAIGECGLVMGGAAGDEIDSADRALGTPAETLVLATSSDHSDAYWLVVEDIKATRDAQSGSEDRRIRADVTLTPRRDCGAVFAVGSISWTGCLSHDDYENPVARLSENVLRAFASGRSPWLAEGSSDPEPRRSELTRGRRSG